MKKLILISSIGLAGAIGIISSTSNAESYKLAEDYVIRLSDGAQIPTDPKNRDYADYLVWVEKGNTPKSKDEEKIHPKTTEEKLKSINITIEELKGALGI